MTINLKLYATYMQEPIIDPITGCWTRERDTVHKRDKMMYRATWQLTHGPIPDGMHICHHCDNPACWNPEHLFMGTAQDNVDDRKRKGRSASGDRHWTKLHPRLARKTLRKPKARLTDRQRRRIKRLRAQGYTYPRLGVMFGVHHRHIYRICRVR